MQTSQNKIAFTTKVMQVFTDVQKSISIHKTQIFQLVKFLEEDPYLFAYAFEQSYLKIFHSFHSRSNKKIPVKFEALAESFFETVLPKKGIESINSNHALDVFNKFLCLCTEGLYSSIMNIRVMCSRLVFLLLKLVPIKKMDTYLMRQTQQQITSSTLHLLRTKVSTYRQLGIKLSSLILHLNESNNQQIEKELFKILAIEENQQIRKLVITNLTITVDNLEEVLIRLRDKNPEIRSIVAKKLQGERFGLEKMTISNVYKLLYDGFGSKEPIVKKQCLRYFAMFFAVNESMETENQSRYRQFVNIFRPDLLLMNPHLYHLFDQLISDLLEEIQSKQMLIYIRKSCDQLKNSNLTTEIIWLKNAINSPSREIAKAYEEYGPTGVDLAKVLFNLSSRHEPFAIHELLQLFGRQKMPDEIGRNKMFDSLKNLLSKLDYFQVRPNYENFKDSDICHILHKDEIERRKIMLSYYDMPIISNSFDLIYEIGEAMKNLRPEHYEIQMKEVMAEWHNPEENILNKSKELIERNIEQLKLKQEHSLIAALNKNLEEINTKIEHENEKTRKVLICISRLRHNCDLQMFMSIIKQELGKENKANGLLLLGLYCLENKDKVMNFWRVFWEYIEKKDISGYHKNHLLVSLKVIVDFVVKFNFLSSDQFKPEGVENFNADIFMNEMIELMLNQDADVRILAIESLCRLLYHERVDKANESTYFLYLILLWLETSTEIISAKSVHTVSIFIKSYIEKGNAYSLKLSEIFCLFFKVLIKFNEQKKTINKSLIKYNLTMEEFIKKTIFTVMTIFKYQKQSHNVIWIYNPQESEIGPQQFLLLYLLKEDKIVPMVGKALGIVDFFQFCSLETLILVKKVVEEMSDSKRWKGVIEQSLKKLQSDIENQISLKNSQTFNDHALEQMEKQNAEKVKLLKEEARYIHKNIEERNIFVRVDYEGSSDEENESEMEESQSNDSNQFEENQVSNGQSSLPSRKKMSVIDLSEEEKNEQEVLLRKGKAAGAKKKQNVPATPVMPVRVLRNRKKIAIE